MIAYMTHVFDEQIGSPNADHYLPMVANRFIWTSATSFAKPQLCERPHRASRIRMYTKCWQRAYFLCRFTLTTLLLQSDYMPTDLPSAYTRNEEYTAPTLDYSSTPHLWISHWIIILNGLFKKQHATVLRIVQKPVPIGTYDNLPLRYSSHQKIFPD